MNLTKSKTAKFVAGIVGLAMAVTFIAPGAAKAQTTADLQAQIAALLAQIAQLQSLVGQGGGSAMTGTAPAAPLTIGSQGAEVTKLQNFLISKGFAIPAGATGYFGSQTKAALAAYQSANGISPAVGYYGPITAASVSSMIGPVVVTPPGGTPPTPPSSLSGTDGNISTITTLTQYSDEEVGESQNDVKVAGFEVEASNDGDIALKSVKLVFDPTGNASGDSDHLDDYIDGVTLWMGSTKIGSADVDEFSKNSDDTYSKVVTVNNPVIKSDTKEKFYITVDAVNSFDSSDIDSDDWSVGVQNIRFVDGSGVVTTETSALPTGAGEIGWDSTDDGVEIDFVSFSTAADTELKISTASDSPDAGIVIVDDSNDTNDVVLLKGKLRLDGTSDINIDEFPVTLTMSTTTGADNVGQVRAITGNLTLRLGSEEYSESVSTAAAAGSITFDNLDFDMSAGDTVNFTVLADINNINNTGAAATDFDEGDQLTADVTASNRSMIDAENQEGDQLAENEKTGTATGDAQEFRTEGVSLSLVSTATSVTSGQSSNDDLGTFTIKFKVTAVGDTVYVASTAAAALSGTANNGATVAIDRAGTPTTGGTSVTIVDETDETLTSNGNFMIEEGETHTFTITGTAQLPTAGSAGQYRMALTGLDWDTTDADAIDLANTYTSNLDTFKTSYLGLN